MCMCARACMYICTVLFFSLVRRPSSVLRFPETRAVFDFWKQLARFPQCVWFFLRNASSVGVAGDFPAGMPISLSTEKR